jgi:tritrans,polycis-undecaprenyl-diphosphate synthase [geranylgeranyl-diphosphate specific]
MIKTNIPAHIGIIPDGNRRYARKLLKSPWEGHESGIEKFTDFLEWCSEAGVKSTTFYVLSLENLENRPKKELEYLFSLAEKNMKDIISNRENSIHRNEVKINFIGIRRLLPENIQRLMAGVEDVTKNYKKHTLNLAMAYGGRQEINEAARRLAFDVKSGRILPGSVNESIVRSYLMTNGSGDPDMIIRTGGEKRLSNFLTYQSVYSELIFSDKLWPEFGKKDFEATLKEFQARKRNFGK